ncbi:MAG TPA: Flp family type IVb pilin [Phycisphaerae bacterium]|jgi:Flp pilus assembly pilin Flp|nr:Flp family type IVb pilin [Phycisphaerae bacterium]HRR83750.1 Flp family type IVb pilin [Phycisphaerae bacterium]
MRLGGARQYAAGCRRFFAESEAATVTEYAVMLAFLISVMVGGITLLGAQVNNLFTSAVNAGW